MVWLESLLRIRLSYGQDKTRSKSVRGHILSRPCCMRFRIFTLLCLCKWSSSAAVIVLEGWWLVGYCLWLITAGWCFRWRLELLLGIWCLGTILRQRRRRLAIDLLKWSIQSIMGSSVTFALQGDSKITPRWGVNIQIKNQWLKWQATTKATFSSSPEPPLSAYYLSTAQSSHFLHPLQNRAHIQIYIEPPHHPLILLPLRDHLINSHPLNPKLFVLRVIGHDVCDERRVIDSSTDDI